MRLPLMLQLPALRASCYWRKVYQAVFWPFGNALVCTFVISRSEKFFECAKKKTGSTIRLLAWASGANKLAWNEPVIIQIHTHNTRLGLWCHPVASTVADCETPWRFPRFARVKQVPHHPHEVTVADEWRPRDIHCAPDLVQGLLFLLASRCLMWKALR